VDEPVPEVVPQSQPELPSKAIRDNLSTKTENLVQKETKWYEKPKFTMMLDALDCRKDLLKHIHDLDAQETDLRDNILQYTTMNDVLLIVF
jgi:hypothetical protein